MMVSCYVVDDVAGVYVVVCWVVCVVIIVGKFVVLVVVCWVVDIG